MFRRPVESFYLRQEQHYDIYDYQGTICSILNNLGVLGAVKNFKLSSRPLVASFASTSAVTAVTAIAAVVAVARLFTAPVGAVSAVIAIASSQLVGVVVTTKATWSWFSW